MQAQTHTDTHLRRVRANKTVTGVRQLTISWIPSSFNKLAEKRQEVQEEKEKENEKQEDLFLG